VVRRGVAGDDLAGADQAGARETVEGSDDFGVLHLLAHQVQIGFVGLIAGGGLVVLLLGDGVVFQHEVGPLAVQFGQPEIGLRLFHRSLQFAGVQPGQHVAFFDRLAFLEVDGVQGALHFTFHVNSLVGGNGGHQGNDFLQRFHPGRFRAHPHGRARRRSAGTLFFTAAQGAGRHGHTQRHPYPRERLHRQPSFSWQISLTNFDSKSR
jgi:hypothetical protein